MISSLVSLFMTLAQDPSKNLDYMAAGIIGTSRLEVAKHSIDDELKIVQATGFSGYRVSVKKKIATVTLCKMADCERFEVEENEKNEVIRIEKMAKEIRKRVRWNIPYLMPKPREIHGVNKERKKEYDRNYNAQHKEQKAEYLKSYVEENRDTINQQHRDKHKKRTRKIRRETFPQKHKASIIWVEGGSRDIEFTDKGETPEQAAQSNELYKMVWATIKTMTNTQQEIAKLILDEVEDSKIAHALDLQIEEIKQVRQILKESLQ